MAEADRPNQEGQDIFNNDFDRGVKAFANTILANPRIDSDTKLHYLGEVHRLRTYNAATLAQSDEEFNRWMNQYPTDLVLGLIFTAKEAVEAGMAPNISIVGLNDLEIQKLNQLHQELDIMYASFLGKLPKVRE